MPWGGLVYDVLTVTKSEGIEDDFGYLAFMLYVLMAATHHPALPVHSTAMLAFVLLLTGVTLFLLWRRAIRAKRQWPGTFEG